METIGYSLGGAIAGFAGTWLIIWMFGLEIYADYMIDLAKISLLLLFLEFLPNGYSLFKQQSDDLFAKSYPAFYSFMTIILTLAAIGLANVEFFEHPNIFLIAYVGLSVQQFYLDCQLQASGHLAAYYGITALKNILRVIFLLVGTVVMELDRNSSGSNVSHHLWGSLAASLLLSLILASWRHRPIFVSLIAAGRWNALVFLWQERRAYRPYYLNSLLKRAKDTMLPLLVDALGIDKALAGLILVYAKSFEVVAGQLRVIEAAFTNLALRARLATSRLRIAWVAAAIGQPACILIAAILLQREGLGVEWIIPAIPISFGVYPYVFEILARNDALASGRPRMVTASLLSYVAILGIGLLSLAWLQFLEPLPITLVLLASLCGGCVCYRLSWSAYEPKKANK